MNRILVFAILSLWCFKTEALEVFCLYYLHKEFNFEYACKVKQLEITAINERNISVATGHHLEARDDFAVTIFSSYQREINFFPRNLGTIFKNLETIIIQSGNLKEISSADLKPFGEKLKILNLFGNSIEAIEVDLFAFNLNLRKINLGGNKIKHVDHDSFKMLKALKELKFERNSCYSGFALKASDIPKLLKFLGSFCLNEIFLLKREIKRLTFDFEKFKGKFVNCECFIKN